MRLVTVDERTATFASDGSEVVKTFRRPDRWDLLRCAREAYRDFLYMKHGDNWRAHDFGAMGSNFWTAEWTPMAEEIIRRADELRPDLFGVKDAAASR